MDKALTQIQENLDMIKHHNIDGTEFWSARDLMTTLGYSTWAKFKEVLEKAKLSCKTTGQEVTNHFAGSGKMVLTGSGAKRTVEDILLTRYTCYLVAQNGTREKYKLH